MKENKPDGAGCLPIAEHNNIKYLLLHTKTKGKKVGFWIGKRISLIFRFWRCNQ